MPHVLTPAAAPGANRAPCHPGRRRTPFFVGVALLLAPDAQASDLVDTALHEMHVNLAADVRLQDS